MRGHWDKAELVRWFDQELHRGGQNAGLPAAESQAWLNRVVDHLIAERGIEIPILGRKRHELAELIYHRIVDHGRDQVRKAAQTLFASDTERLLETTFEMPFEVMEQNYAPYRRYTEGPFSYPKHAFDLIGEMEDEESQCAKKIDDHPNVKRWLRNLTHESAGGFSLPLSPGRFFPDFLAELNDGRIAIVEYKGRHRASLPEEIHKKDVGEMWEARSSGQCVFVWVVNLDWTTLRDRLVAVPPR
jgi:type III restriction enzyme